MTDVIRSALCPAQQAARSTADTGMSTVGAIGENNGSLGLCNLSAVVVAGSLARNALPRVITRAAVLAVPWSRH